MKFNQSLKTLLPLAAFAGLTLSANAAVIGIDFRFNSSGATHSGDPDKTAPLHLSTQTNPWNVLVLGGTNPTVITAEGPTFTITGVMNSTYEAFYQPATGRSALREDLMASNSSRRFPGPISWELTGLTANAIYDLSFFRGNNDEYVVDITGATAVGDADGDVNFTGVLSGTGSIGGTFDVLTPNLWSSLSGLQFEQTGVIAAVPEPTTTALLGLGGLALILRRRK